MSSKDRGGKPVDDADAATGRPYPLLWNQLPSLKIVRQAKGTHSAEICGPAADSAPGRYSPQVDERCFSYCSQSVRGRIEQREPWCRTFCLRRVFAHEMQRAVAARDAQARNANAKARLPLPPEGQHVPSLGDVLVGETPESQGHAPPDDVRYWEEGYYVWLSKSRWATQERLDLMMTSLERQAQWDKYKQDRTEAWEQQQQQMNKADGETAKGNSGVDNAPKGPAGPPSPTRRPFPDLRCVARCVLGC